MKKIKKALLTIGMLCLASVSCIAITACGDTSDSENNATYTYVFNTNGGGEISNVTVDSGAEYVLPIPERAGYAFEGWYTNADFTGEAVKKAVGQADVTYYAKWTQLSTITLELNGGAFAESGSTTLYLKAGENLYNFMQAYVPTKQGLIFGAWFNGTTELSTAAKMPEAGITLTAKYKVEYIVEYYLRNLADDGYDKTVETDSAYVGAEVISDKPVDGFKEVMVTETLASKVLTETASENVLRRYFERQTITVTFNPNLPSAAGVTLEKKVLNKKYGVPIEMACDYVCDGYVLVGWSTSANGEIAYKADYISTVLYNKGDADSDSVDTIVPVRNTVLYGVWVKGYTDFFGGSDYLYILDTAREEAYLCRGNVFYKGEYDAKDKTFYILDEKDSLMAEGKIYDSKTYIYYSSTRDDYWAILNDKGSLVESTVIRFDAYNGIEYAEQNGKISRGTYSYNIEEGYYVAVFTDGSLKNKKLTFVLGKDVDGKTDTFTIRNEEELKWGKLVRFAVEKGELTVYQEEYTIKLDGLGKATYINNSKEQEYFYEINGEILTLKDSAGDMFGNAILMEYQGIKGYCRYVEDEKQTYTFKSGDTLVTDGGCQAVYTAGNTVIKGFYQTEKSLVGGTLITMLKEGGRHIFTVTSIKEKQPVLDSNGNETGETEEVTVSTIIEKQSSYKEYKYQAKGGSENTYVLTLNEPSADKATLYAYKPSTGTYVKVSVGAYARNDETGYYEYEASEFFSAKNVIVSPFDPKEIKKCIFAIDEESLDYGVCYWYSVISTTDDELADIPEYTADDGAKLKFVGGYAFLTKANGVTVSGPTSVHATGYVTIMNTSEKVFIEIDEKQKTFVQLSHRPYDAQLLQQDGYVNTKELFHFDGKGNVVYEVTEYIDNGNDKIVTKYPGTMKNLNISSAFEATIMEFRSNDGQFVMKFITLQGTDRTYVAIYNEEYNGDYESADGILKLDGFAFNATYIDDKSVTHEGRYSVKTEDDGTVYVQFYENKTEKYYYFDLKKNRQFTKRGDEYGEYLLMENRYTYSYCEFNGYGKLKVYNKEYNAETNKYDRIYIDDNGSYVINDGVVTITYYIKENKQITFKGELSTYINSGVEQLAFIARNKYSVRIYVNQEDWSILELDDIGGAVKYTQEGVKENGYYTLITDEFLYYESQDGKNSCLFKYDYEKGTAKPIKYKPKGYYTSELEALHFSESGFAIFGGETSYYYKVENGVAIIYRQDPLNSEANKYGFVEEEFGAFTSEKVWNGKTYHENNGYAINFNRAKNSDTLYPVQLKTGEEAKYPLQGISFQPSGSGEFSVAATVYINNQIQSCKVIREIKENGDAELYVQWGFYRFYIQVVYNGVNADGESNNTYEVVGMKYVDSLYSYSYLDMYYFYAALGLPGLQDMCGMLTIVGEYDEQGNPGAFHMEADFMDGLRVRDLTGALISFKDGSYAYDAATQIYRTRFKGSDGKTYGLHFQKIYQKAFDLYAYGIMAFTYEQEFDLGNGYKVQVEKVLWTQAKAVTEDTVYALRLFYNDQEIEHEGILASGNSIYYIHRDREAPADGEKQGKIKWTKYYRIDFTPMAEGTKVGDDRELEVFLFESATLHEETIKTVYSENGKLFVDYSVDREEITLISMVKHAYVGQETVYDEDTKEYTVSVNGGKVFTVKFNDDGTVYIMEKVVDSE